MPGGQRLQVRSCVGDLLSIIKIVIVSCVCVRESARERESESERESASERETKRESERDVPRPLSNLKQHCAQVYMHTRMVYRHR